MAEVLLSRIVEQHDRLEPQDIPAIFEVLGKGVDVLEEYRHSRDDRSPRFLKGGEASFFGLIQRLDKDPRNAVLKKLFKPGMSYSWLCGIIREATFEHGFDGDRVKPEEERLLTTGEFNMIRKSYLNMIHKAEPAALLKVPYLLNFLFSWLQLGEMKEVREWVALQSQTDEGLLDLLERMGSSRQASNGKFYNLKPINLRHFFDNIDAVYSRITRLSEDEHQNPDIQEKAKKLKDALDEGEELERTFPS